MTTVPPPPPKPSRPLPGKLPVGKPVADALDVVLDFGDTPLKDIGDKILVYAPPGWGKTTLPAYAERPMILKGPNENGYDTLLKYGNVPNVPSRDIQTWPELRAVTQKLAVVQHDRKWLGLDSLTVIEMLCRQHVCDTYFGGDWGESKGAFGSWGKGEDKVEAEWCLWLNDLERLTAKGMSIMPLCHSEVKTVKNPEGADYDSYQIALRPKTRAATERWANAILFGRYVTAVDVDSKSANKNTAEQKGKGVGGRVRIMRCENRDSATAKNQMKFPETIDIPNDPSQAFAAIAKYLK